MPDYAQRRDRLRRLLKETGADSLLVTDFTNVTYLTGFKGDESYLVVDAKKEILITDRRYSEQLETECPDLELAVREPPVQMLPKLVEVLQAAKVKKLAVEGDSLTLGQATFLQKELAEVEIVPTSQLVLHLREIKDKEEVDLIRGAISVAERAFNVVRAMIRPDMTEKQIADELDHQIRLFGGSGCSFPPIVGVGPRAALPHGRPTEMKAGESPFVLIDWGAKVNFYISDSTRVLTTAKLAPKFEKIYNTVLKANQAGIEAIKPGAIMEDVDAAARKVIEGAGYGKMFGHSLGHGIGLQVHEQPRLAKEQKQPLKAGMVVTVEPGIYIPGWGGVRIEDDVLVTKSGNEVLTTTPKNLYDCVIT